MTVEPYIKGVERGITDGKIRFYPEELKPYLGPEDDYAHIAEKGGRLHEKNTRDLAQEATIILEIMKAKKTDQMRFLFLGPGTGKEICDARNIVPNAHIETIGCTPINPEIHFQKSWDTILEELGKSKSEQEQPNNIDYLLSEQERFGFDWWQRKPERPIVDLQHIGLLADVSPTLNEGKYDLVYEKFGPVYYSYDSCSTEYHLPTPNAEDECMEQMQDILTPDGVMILMQVRFRSWSCLQRIHNPRNALLFLYEEGGPAIFAKEESHIAQKFLGKNSRDRRIFYVSEEEYRAALNQIV